METRSSWTRRNSSLAICSVFVDGDLDSDGDRRDEFKSFFWI
jgi:hypothetical protein